MRGNLCGQAGRRSVSSTARVAWDGVSGIMKMLLQLSGRQYLNAERIMKEPFACLFYEVLSSRQLLSPCL